MGGRGGVSMLPGNIPAHQKTSAQRRIILPAITAAPAESGLQRDGLAIQVLEKIGAFQVLALEEFSQRSL